MGEGGIGRTAKWAMSERKTVVLTTLSMEEPASARTALTCWTQRAVFSAMEPPTRTPWPSMWIWPEQ